MKPFLFEGSFLETPTYYVLYLLGFLAAIILATKKAKRDGLNPVRAVDLGMVLFITGVLGARLFHIIFESPRYYLDHPLRIFYFWQGGFVLYGGIIGGTIGGILFLRWLKEPVARWADLVAPCFYLGLAIGRAGCLSAGCCYGKNTELLWGVVFSDPRSAAPLHLMLHPTQFLEMLFAFIMCAVTWRLFPGPTKRPSIALVFAFMTYALFRFFLEFLRGDPERGLYFNGVVSMSQMVSILVILGGLVWLRYFCKKV